MRTEHRFWLFVSIGLAAGLIIGWVDTRPTWDDTGITVGLIFLVSAVMGAWHPSQAWAWGLVVGCGVPLMHLFVHGNPAALVSFVIAFAGSYAGALSRRLAGGPR